MNPNQQIQLSGTDVRLFVKREDLLDAEISGNKLRKLKYNLLHAQSQRKTMILTFGGAFSNHIASVAAAGKRYGFNTIGVIRGEELSHKIDDNPTLSIARANGMQLEFVSRQVYKMRSDEAMLGSLQARFPDAYILPEGGTNALAVKGCEEILAEEDAQFDYICCAVGTGGTLAGIANSAKPAQKVIGFSSLKGVSDWPNLKSFCRQDNWYINSDYHFGGYGKADSELVRFINRFSSENKMPLDPVYTGKMLFGIIDMIGKGEFEPGSKVLAIHTGGLQGIDGMNQRLKNKNLHIHG